MARQLLTDSPEKRQRQLGRRRPELDYASSFLTPYPTILRLQPTLGNRSVARLIQTGSRTVIARALPGVQRKCNAAELGAPRPDCTASQQGATGWQLLFKAGCDALLPGEESKIDKLKPGNQLKIHGFASREGGASFNDDLSCHRANKIAELVRSQRADCPVTATLKHGASPASAASVAPDSNPRDFWRSVIIEEIKPKPESGEAWLDPARFINTGWALYNRAQQNPTLGNLDIIAKTRANLLFWLQETPRDLAEPGAELTRRNLDDYRRFYASAEQLWGAIDRLLALKKHPAAAKDTYEAWASTTGERSKMHARSVPAGAKYHIDIFGEGYYKGAVNIGMAERSETTQPGARVPDLIYRRFSSKDANHIPIADHVADMVTAESGPIEFPGLVEEIARIIAPGGTIVIYGPKRFEPYHDKVAKVTGGQNHKSVSGKNIA